jgi:hypothetical protein
MKRNSYGEIIDPKIHVFQEGKLHPIGNQYDIDVWADARCLITLAIEKKRIPANYDYITRDRKGRFDGAAMHHEIYDIAEHGRHVLLCIRETEGNKYGVKTTKKEYFIISAHGPGVRVKAAPKAKAAKAAKQAGDDNYGAAIAVCLGKKKP